MLSLLAGFGFPHPDGILPALEGASVNLQALWASVFGHLWETTLFFLGVLLISQLFHQAPAALRHRLWSLALLKLFLPVSLLGWCVERWGLFEGDSVRSLTVLTPLAWSGPIGSRVVPGDVTSPMAMALLWIGTIAWLGVASWIALRKGSFAHRLASNPPVALAEPMRARIEELTARLDVPVAQLIVTDQPTLPCVAGIVRPRIYLPLQMLETQSRDAVFAVALHERAHLRRREPLQMLFRRLALALFFYFPPLWFVLGRLHRTAEVACDEAAVAAGADARVLVRTISLSLRSGLRAPSPAAALGSTHRSLLAERLQRLESNRRYRSMHHHRGALALTALALAALVFAPRPDKVEASGGEPIVGETQGTTESAAEVGTPVKEQTAPAVEESEATKPSSGPTETESEIIPPRPIPETMASPDYPEDCRQDGASGRVLLKLRISDEGAVTEAEEIEGVEGYPAFTTAAMKAVLQWRFEPATQDGDPVPIEVVVPVQFALD